MPLPNRASSPGSLCGPMAYWSRFIDRQKFTLCRDNRRSNNDWKILKSWNLSNVKAQLWITFIFGTNYDQISQGEWHFWRNYIVCTDICPSVIRPRIFTWITRLQLLISPIRSDCCVSHDRFKTYLCLFTLFYLYLWRCFDKQRPIAH